MEETPQTGNGSESRQTVRRLTRALAVLAVVFLSIHVVTAVVDPDAAVGFFALVFPFAGSSSPLWIGLGTLALELVVALVATSLLRRHLSRRTWRGLHWLAYVAWPLALLHGIGIGTDTATTWMTAVDLACVASIGVAASYRLLAPAEAAR
jgi:sulfoxide reductase heme-binding subunit YedZ